MAFYHRTPLLRNSVVLLHDLLVASLAYGLALYLRLGNEMVALPWPAAGTTFLLYLGICAISFVWFGLHRGVWRYTSLHDAMVIVRAVFAAMVAFVLLAFFVMRGAALPRSTPPLLMFILPTLLAGSRVTYRLWREKRLTRIWQTAAPNAAAQPILLLGAGDEAEVFIRTVSRDPKSAWNIVGVVDVKGNRVGRMIHRVSVFLLDDLPGVVSELSLKGYRPQRLILTRDPSTYSSEQLRQAMDYATQLNLPLGRLPSLTELRNAIDASAGLVRPVAVEDLLGRPEINLRREVISGLITGRRVVVTGAGGTIGSELCRQIAALGPSRLAIIDNSEFNLYTIDQEIRAQWPGVDTATIMADVRDRGRIEKLFMHEQPELVFHAAALKHVPIAETNVREAVLTNIQGSQNVADAARASGAKALVMISTDKAINPSNVMGASKRVAEAYCQTLDMAPQNNHATRFVTVRFGNVLGSSGSVIPLFQKQLAKGGPLTVTHPDVTRYFMTVHEAVQLVLQASAHGVANESARGKIFVLDMGKPVKIIDLARQMIQLAGLRPDEDIKINITGLRPGEKLHEELFSPDELVQSGVGGVMVADARVLDATGLADGITALTDHAVHNADETILMQSLQKLVPEYTGGRGDTTNVIPLASAKARS